MPSFTKDKLDHNGKNKISAIHTGMSIEFISLILSILGFALSDVRDVHTGNSRRLKIQSRHVVTR